MWVFAHGRLPYQQSICWNTPASMARQPRQKVGHCRVLTEDVSDEASTTVFDLDISTMHQMDRRAVKVFLVDFQETQSKSIRLELHTEATRRSMMSYKPNPRRLRGYLPNRPSPREAHVKQLRCTPLQSAHCMVTHRTRTAISAMCGSRLFNSQRRVPPKP